MDNPELWTNLGILLAATIAGLAGYFGPRILRQPPASSSTKVDAVIGGVGLELGNRAQMDMLIQALNRIADAIENKNQATIEDMLRDIKDDMESMKVTRRPR